MGGRILIAMTLALAALAGPGSVALAAPAGVVVAPRVAASGTSVVASGSGCAAPAHVTVTGFLFPAPPALVTDVTVPAAVDGTWQATFPMPAMPAYVLVECDGVTSAPVVIAPSDVDAGSLGTSSVTTTQVVISTSPLVNGSTFAVFDLDGDEIASSTVAGGVGSVTVPRSLGPATLLAVALRQPNLGIPLPWIPLALRVQLPLPSATTVEVDRHVATAGESVTASGTCAGSPQLTVAGRPAGWYDAPPVYVNVVPPLDGAGHWSATFPMPVLPSTVTLRCTSASVIDVVAVRISPSAGALPSIVPTVAGSEAEVAVPNTAFQDTLLAYTADGVPVPLSISPAGLGFIGRLPLAPNPGRIVLVGVESLGENAIALQNSRVQAWTVDVPGTGATPSPAPGIESTPSPVPDIDLPATDAEVSRSGEFAAGPAGFVVIAALGLLAALLVIASHARRAR
ncbi:MAG TPA: hypothetical protein VFX65_11325 [Candidatus Limnocylindrales bacterium]|nr:hypothetical protein [Candidatus Limnocylindrales bacterium]